jgi:hypothetical protein
MDSMAGAVDIGRQAGDAVRLDAGAYGTLCAVVPPLLDSLQSVVVDCIVEAAWSLRDTGGRLRDTASGYQSTDEHVATIIQRLRST